MRVELGSQLQDRRTTQERWSYERNHPILQQNWSFFQCFNLSKMMKKIISANQLITEKGQQSISIQLSNQRDSNDGQVLTTLDSKDPKDLDELFRICVDLSSIQNSEVNKRVQDLPQPVIDINTPQFMLKKRLAKYYDQNICTCSSTLQSDSFVIHAFAEKEESSVSISLIIFQKKANQVKNEIKFFSAKGDNRACFMITTIKWINQQTLACGTSSGQIIIMDIQNISLWSTQRQKYCKIQKISLAGISEILCLKRPQEKESRNSHFQLIQRVCFLTKDEQILIGSILKGKDQQESKELVFILLYRLNCLNISSLVEAYGSFHKQFYSTSHLIQIKEQQTSMIIQATFSGVIKVWKLPQFQCKAPKCSNLNTHFIQQCFQKKGQPTRQKQIENDLSFIKSKKDARINRKVKTNKAGKAPPLQTQICQNTIVMLGDKIFQGFLPPTGLMLNNSFFDNSYDCKNSRSIYTSQTALMQNLLIDCDQQEEQNIGQQSKVLEESLTLNESKGAETNNGEIPHQVSKFPEDSRMTDLSEQTIKQFTDKQFTYKQFTEQELPLNRSKNGVNEKKYCSSRLKHKINPQIVVSSAITESSLLSIGLYGSLLAIITADGYLTFLALQITAGSNEQYEQNYEIITRRRVFQGERPLNECSEDIQNKYLRQFEDFQHMQIKQNVIYLVLNKYQFEQFSQNIGEIETYVKKLQINEELEVESIDFVFLKRSKLKNMSFYQKQSKIKQHLTAQLILLQDTRIRICSPQMHVVCKSQCYALFNRFAVRMGTNFFHEQSVSLDTEQSFDYLAQVLQQSKANVNVLI